MKNSLITPHALSLVDLFDRQATRTPDAIALVDGVTEISFWRLDTIARHAATHLQLAGIGPGDRVGHCFNRSAEAIAAIIAILKVGAAWVPIAADAPAHRRNFMLKDSGAKAVICGREVASSMVPCAIRVIPWPMLNDTLLRPDDQLAHVQVDPTSPAWVLYTSGSSGQPKGVIGTHLGCVTRLRAVWQHQPFVSGERCFQHTAFTTVDAFWEIFAPLCAGHALYIVDDTLISDPERLLPHLAELGIRRICMVPSLLALLIDLFPSLHAVVPDLKLWVVSGEPLTWDLCARFRHATQHAQLFNQYGLTESCADITAYDTTQADVSDTSRYTPIGRPFAGTTLFIIDEDSLPVPDGIPGELCIAGDCLSAGYVNQPQHMDERFFPLVTAGEKTAQRVFRTGDRVVRLTDGNLLYLGRIDSQINLRGYRIEPGEVEAAIATHQGVAQTAVALREIDAFQKHLVAWVTLRPGVTVTPSALQRHTASLLPGYMLPAVFVVLDAMPLTPTGKTDRRALASISPLFPADADEATAASGTEGIVSEVLAACLRRERVGIHDNFFDIGGNSLIAMQATSRLRSRFGVNLPMSLIFSESDVRSLAKYIDQQLADGDHGDEPPLVPAGGNVPVMSYGQERLWFFERLQPGTATYTICWHLRLRGKLDHAALTRALAEIVQRHDVLRSQFSERHDTGITLIRHAPDTLVTTQCISAHELPGSLETCANLPFDVEKDPLYRFTLLQLSPEDHCLSVAIHHAVFDGGSMPVLNEELCALYSAFSQGQRSPLPPMAVQFADYAHWQRAWLDEKRLNDLAGWWREQLFAAPQALELPTDRLRPAVASYRGAHLPFSLNAGTSQALRELARRADATLFMVLFAAFNVVLSRWSGQHDIVVGSPIAGRHPRETESMIGFFVNTLALRTDLSADPTFAELLQRVRQTTLGAYTHQDLPFEKLVEALQPDRDLSRQAVFQVMFALHPEQPVLSMAGLHVDVLEGQATCAKFDLTLELVDAMTGIAGTVEFATDIWDASTAARFAEHFSNLLTAITRDPLMRISALPMLSDKETRALLPDENHLVAPYNPDHSIAALFAAQVALTPQATALCAQGTTLSYSELEDRANRLATWLRKLGVGPDVLVGLCLPRSIDMVVSLLAITKAGGAYVPIDPGYPAERISWMLNDASVRVLITQADIARHLPDSAATRVLIDEAWSRHAVATDDFALPESEADHLAYVIYTSGTTGRPKGVMVRQRGLNNLLQWFVKDIGMTTDDAVLLVSSHSFDLTQKNIFGPLITGGVLHLAAEPFDPFAIVQQIQRESLNFINCTPSAFYALIEANDGHQLRSLRRVMLGGEPIQVAKLMQLPEPRPQFINSYGPTECSDVDVFHVLSRDLQDYRIGVPLGRAVRNTQLYVLDACHQLVPQGVTGELYIAGIGLARGYLHRPELTAERFVPNPFYRGAQMYRTGDLARWNADGNLEYLGRTDHQVKLRGFRIETGEIEAALLACPQVGQALVMACDDHRGQLQLVAWLVGDDGFKDETLLRQHLRTMLPEPMIPACFVWLEQMPLSPNGKIDRKALPPPGLPPAHKTWVAPASELEQSVATLFAEILQRDHVGRDDDFFALGGHSLLAMRAVGRIRQTLNRELPLRELFDHPTVKGVARRLASLKEDAFVPSLPVHSRCLAGPLPLSFAQERLWFLERLGMTGSAYHIPWVLQLTGDVKLPALERAIAAVLNRHDVLRTRFGNRNGRPEQIVDAPSSFSLPVRHLPPAMLEAALQTLAEQPFDLTSGPLCRFHLLQTDASTFHLSIVAHHIICDGWSVDLMTAELCAWYAAFAEGRPAPLQPLALQYADYASWQHTWLDEKRLHEQAAWWRQQLQGAPAALNLPTDHPRPTEISYRGGQVPFSLSAEVLQGLRELASKEGVTLFMLLLAALNVVLSRWSGQDDIVVGSPIAGRTQRETEPIIGFFVNTLALRTNLSGDPSFSTLLKRVRRTTLDAYAHQDLPFGKLVEALQPVRDRSRQAIFQVMLALHTAAPGPTIAGLALETREGRTPTAKFDLSLEATLKQDQLHACVEYASDLFDQTTIERLVAHYLHVLAWIAAQPDCPIGQIPLLSAAEREQQLISWNATHTTYPDAHLALHQLIERQVQRCPHAVALLHAGGQLSYDQLNQRANQLAHDLLKQGIGPGSLVALCMHRSPEMVIALLGILKAGAAWVPLDPGHPTQRIAHMVAASGSTIVLTQQNLVRLLADLHLQLMVLDGDNALADRDPWHNPGLYFHPDQLACCLFTSGSTGQPKGVMTSHRALVNRLLWMQAQYPLTSRDTVLQKTPYSFDVSIWEFFWPLMIGARLAIARPEGHKDPHYLAQALRDYRVTTVHFVPAMLQVFLAQNDEDFPLLRCVFASGEALPAAVQRQFCQRHPQIALHNLYGPTEAAIDVSYWPCTADHDTVPIGFPVANTQLYLLNEALQPVPAGSTAEIYIAGVQLARGYLGRPDLTAEKFLPNPYGEPGSRMYRTGDLGRYQRDGSIEYLGRTDHQVKLRGLRIELGEIENTLLSLPGVREAVVVMRSGQLVAYVALNTPAPSQTQLQEQLHRQLPEYMVPALWVVLPALPLNTNGKIDRKALPDPLDQGLNPAYVAPVNDTQRLLASLWGELFQREHIGINDNFFALGGHSLLTVQLLYLMEQRTGVQIPLREFFEAPTVRKLASRIDGQLQTLATLPADPPHLNSDDQHDN